LKEKSLVSEEGYGDLVATYTLDAVGYYAPAAEVNRLIMIVGYNESRVLEHCSGPVDRKY